MAHAAFRAISKTLSRAPDRGLTGVPVASTLRVLMNAPFRTRIIVGIAAAWCAMPLQSRAAPPPPTFEPDGGTWPAPLKVMIRCAAPEASVHVTLDGKEPTPRDTEIEPGSEIVVDEPLTLKAKAWLPDGSASATKTATYTLRPVLGNAASFVDQAAPVLMAAGRTQRLTFTLRNIGTIPWTRGVHALAPYRTKDAELWSIGPIAPAEPVPTWGAATFAAKVTAPAAPGTYNLRFRMQGGGQAFGEATPVVRVAVVSVEEYERETKASVEREPAAGGKSAAARTGPLPKTVAAALAAARAQSEPAAAADLDRLARELQRSARSFRYLRTIGFTQSDEEFARLVAARPAIFKPVRIVRRDERGQRIIPGWPGAALAGER